MQNKKITPFNEILDQVKKNQELLEKGNKTFLTLQPLFPRFSKYLPGFIKGELITITGSTGHGKSKLTWHLCNSFLKYKEFDVHILYNALEESKIKIASNFILNYLAKRGYDLTFYKLLNYQTSPHSRELLALINEAVDLFNEQLDSRLKIYQETTPSTFYRRVVQYLDTLGKFYYIEKDKKGNEINRQQVPYNKEWNHFEYNNPDTYVIFVSDHIWNYDSEKGMNKYDSIAYFSRYYCRIKLCMQAGCIGIKVQQQENRKDVAMHTSKTGQEVKEHYYPNTKSVADIKSVINDDTVTLGVFAPSRYKSIVYHNGYVIRDKSEYPLGDAYRALFILKTREATQVEGDRSIPLLFDGKLSYFEELPKDVEKGMARFKEYFKK